MQGGGGCGRPGPCRVPFARLVCRELLNAHKDNLGTTIKFVIFNELSNARNPNNMQVLYTVLQHSSELAPKVGSPGGDAATTGGWGGWAPACSAHPGVGLQRPAWPWVRCPLCGDKSACEHPACVGKASTGPFPAGFWKGCL